MWQAQGTDSSSLWLDHSVQVKNGIGALPGTVSRGTKNGLAFDILHCSDCRTISSNLNQAVPNPW